jgi:membrane protein YqaA with SNARE-associated domain
MLGVINVRPSNSSHSLSTWSQSLQTRPGAAEAPGLADGRRLIYKVGRLKSTAGVIGLFALTFFALLHFQEAMSRIGNWGYPSIFLVELINSALLFIPSPGRAYTLSLSLTLNPFLLGLLGGAGAALGEFSGYYAGAKGRRILKEKWFYRWFGGLTERHFGIALFALAFLPVPFDIAGLWAGAVRYPLTRFLLYVAPGKILKMTAIALAGHYGLIRLLELCA